MSRVILNTVGTSLTRPRPDASREDLLSLIARDPVAASAESNALSRLSEVGDEAVFLHSDTPDGELCASVLAEAFTARGLQTRLVRVDRLNFNEKGFVQHGLRNFTRRLSQEVQVAQRAGRSVEINATGGFKAQLTYATVVGLLFGVPVRYIHEVFQDIVTLPPAPVGWDVNLMATYGGFFEWLDAEPRLTRDVQGQVQRLPGSQLPEAALNLIMEDGEFTFLSPLGELMLQAFQTQELKPGQPRLPLLASEAVREALRAFPADLRAEALRVLNRVALGGSRDWERKAETLSGGDAWKFPKGPGRVRVVFVERRGTLLALELAGHYDERRYQDLLSRGVDSGTYPESGFGPLPESGA